VKARVVMRNDYPWAVVVSEDQKLVELAVRACEDQVRRDGGRLPGGEVTAANVGQRTTYVHVKEAEAFGAPERALLVAIEDHVRVDALRASVAANLRDVLEPEVVAAALRLGMQSVTAVEREVRRARRARKRRGS
jgi:hypothetical protein